MNPSFPGAYCAIHRAAAATRTCTRCGNFMCWDCSQGGTRETCPACAELASGSSTFPFTRENTDGLIGYAWNAFTRDWGMLTVTAFLLMICTFGAQLVGAVLSTGITAAFGAVGDGEGAMNAVGLVVGQLLATIIQVAVQGALGLGFARVAWGALNGRGADLGVLFSQFHKLGKYLVQVLLVALVVVVPLALVFGGVFAGAYFAFDENDTRLIAGISVGGVLMIVAICVMLPLYFAQAELALNDQVTPWESIVNAWRIGSGKRLLIFGYSMLIGLILIGGAILCLLPVIPAMAFGQLIFIGLYAALRNGSEASPIRGGGEQPVAAQPAV